MPVGEEKLLETTMRVEYSPNLARQADLEGLARSVQGVVVKVVEQYSRSATAAWDLWSGGNGRTGLMLYLRDPWGATQAPFAPDELRNDPQLRSRLVQMAGDLLQAKRFVELRLEEQVVEDTAKLTELAAELDKHRSAGDGGVEPSLQLKRRADGRWWMTDSYVRVPPETAESVRRIIRAHGFSIAEPELSSDRVVASLKKLVEEHDKLPDVHPDYAVWVDMPHPREIHLLEVSEAAHDPGDAALEGVALDARTVLPEVRSLVVYLASPAEVRRALEGNQAHPVVLALRGRKYKTIYTAQGKPPFDVFIGLGPGPQL